MTAKQITQRAFNAGYLVEKHLPQLSKLLVKGLQGSEHPYVTIFDCSTISPIRTIS